MPRLGVCAMLPAVFTQSLDEPEQKELWKLESRVRSDLLLRDLGGAWAKHVAGSRKAAEVLLTALKPLGRLVLSSDAMTNAERGRLANWSDADWVAFSRKSHGSQPLDLVIRRDDGKPSSRAPEVQLRDFESSSWVVRADATGSVARTESALTDEIRPFIEHAKWLDIVDPGLDPSSSDYAYLEQAIRTVAPTRRTRLLLTVHRPGFELQGGRRPVTNVEWENRFSSWAGFGKNRVLVRVCIWSEVHDRIAASNLGGLHFGNGIASSTRRDDRMTLSWLKDAQAADALRSAVGEKRQHIFTLPRGQESQFRGVIP